MEKQTLVYVISNIEKALAFEWLADSELLQASFNLHFVLLNSERPFLYQYLSDRGYRVNLITYRGKKDIFRAIQKLYRYFKKENATIVHTHLFDAGVTGLLAAWLAGVPKRIYTRHHATMHHTYYPRAVYYDRFINTLATHVVAISENVKNVLLELEQVPAQKIVLIHHGFDLGLFASVPGERVEEVVKRHGIAHDASPIIGVISRYIHLKGIDYIISAFDQVLQEFPNAHLVLANARGDYAVTIQACLHQLPEGSYTEIQFENDLPALYKTFDVYVHVPIDEHSEAFGQTYVEALAAGVPSVFTLSGVAAEFIEDRVNALVVPFKRSDEIVKGIKVLLTDASLRQNLVMNGYSSVQTNFSLDVMMDKLLALYKA